MHIGLGPKPFILATSVFNYADAFDGDLSAWDVSVVIYSARLKSIVYIGWLICTVACAHGVFFASTFYYVYKACVIVACVRQVLVCELWANVAMWVQHVRSRFSDREVF